MTPNTNIINNTADDLYELHEDRDLVHLSLTSSVSSIEEGPNSYSSVKGGSSDFNITLKGLSHQLSGMLDSADFCLRIISCHCNI